MKLAKLWGLALAMGLGAEGLAARGQVIERDVTITGPRGRSIERRLRSERGPDGIEREVEIKRPSGTYRRETHIQPRPGPGHPHPAGGHGPVEFVPQFAPNYEHHAVERKPSWAASLAIGAPLFGFFVGNSPPPPPPPVYVVPEPIYAPPPPVYVYQPPQPYLPPPPPRTVIVDPVAEAIARLGSRHDNSREEGARTLGKLGDPRAVPALVNRLKYDEEEDVRVAAAWALSEIGDPRAAIYLERAATYDKEDEVRRAAVMAGRRLSRRAGQGGEVQILETPGFEEFP